MAKGHKTGGRKKGTPNKVTPEIREAFRKLIEGEHALPFGVVHHERDDVLHDLAEAQLAISNEPRD